METRHTTQLRKVAAVTLIFWVAFLLTRPFGATFGDLLTKSPGKGGLDLGTIGSSAVLLNILTALVAYEVMQRRKLGTAQVE